METGAMGNTLKERNIFFMARLGSSEIAIAFGGGVKNVMGFALVL